MDERDRRRIFTIGHSVHELDAFIGLLERHRITAVADVRSRPFSRLQQFNGDLLATVLRARGIKYVPLGRELGARRDEAECYVDGRAVYELVARLPLFQEGINRLIRGAADHRIAIMCAEKEPLDCHRTVLICRHLRPHDFQVLHILENGELEDHGTTEKRMMEMLGIAPDLFHMEAAEADLIEQAYEVRGRQIAYTTASEGIPA
ncbi:MAG TPA: DUF488 domain-containing protein [Tepidisphaeraceae bacterium]|jgi:uncharacterized protein (DUF488 family)|nr:DUF488 domain-containing protein [Tepidisphaeraceae bacterium]